MWVHVIMTGVERRCSHGADRQRGMMSIEGRELNAAL